jgi:hypothetical protein
MMTGGAAWAGGGSGRGAAQAGGPDAGVVGARPLGRGQEGRAPPAHRAALAAVGWGCRRHGEVEPAMNPNGAPPDWLRG